ncbi:MAG TPA: rhomboid family intramembrane serine protease [Spirochaetota bacterium]|nr:rhomboid family intramembrane serine protease [Spirochaetota bacterium]
MSSLNASNVWQSFKTVLFIVLVLWVILIIGFIYPIENFGIKPRTMAGLPGILLAPFIHAGINHLVTNSISLLILGSIFMTMERKLSFQLLLQIIIIGGFGTWLIGRSEFTHIGASGVIYGILGYLLTMGFFIRNLKAILVSVLVFILYGGAIWGIFPTSGFISWESHLSGFIAGIITAERYATKRSR